MGAISDAANLPRLPDSTNTFADVSNANAIASEGLQNITDSAQQAKDAQIQQAPFQKIAHKFNPKTGKYDVDLSVSSDTFDYLSNLLQTGMQAQSAFSQAQQQLAQKRIFQEQNPVVAGLGRIASTAAAQYGTGYLSRGRDISPLVRAAGAYGLEQFGETPAALAQQEAGLQEQSFGVAAKMSALSQQISYQNRELGIQETAQRIQLAREKDADINKVDSQYSEITNRGAMTPAIVENYKKSLMEKGATLDYANRQAQTALAASEQVLVNKGGQREIITGKAPDGRLHQYAIYTDPRNQKQLGQPIDLGIKEPTYGESLAMEKEKDKQQAIESMAQMLISKDPFMLTQVRGTMSMRSDFAPQAIARAKQLDPSWSPEQSRERVNLVDSITTGKLADSNKSLGQWLNHADEAQSLVKQLEQTDARFANKSLNWMRNNISNSQQAELVSRLGVAYAAVGDEYNNFILSNRAPYLSDKEASAKMTDINQPASKQLANINQMARTIAGRQSENNNQWQRWFGTDLPLAVSPQAAGAAVRLGIPVSQTGSPNAPGREVPATARPSGVSANEQKILDLYNAGQITADEARTRRAALGTTGATGRY